jgi:hypothetical protein
MVYATLVITILSYVAAPTLHHGIGASVNAFFGIDDHFDPDRGEDLQLAVHHVPGRIRFEVPMLWTIGFMVTFPRRDDRVLVVPPADFVLHNSLFLIAHSQRDHRRRAVRHGCRDLLVPGLWLQAQRSWGKCSFWFHGFYFCMAPLCWA